MAGKRSASSRLVWLLAAGAATMLAFRILPSAKATPAAPVLDVTRLGPNIGDAQQLVIVRTAKKADSAGTLTTYEKVGDTWKAVRGPIAAHLGRKGISYDHVEDDGTTPFGIFTLTEMFGRNQDPGVRFPYRQIGADDWWVSDATAPDYYNMWQVGPSNGRWNDAAGEKLSSANYATAYRYATVIDYNRSPVRPGGGSAIFLHVGSSPTSGCVAIAEVDLVAIMRWLDPSKKPAIIGPDDALAEPLKAPSVTGTTAAGFTTVAPRRVLDTRTGLGHDGALGAGATLDLPLAGVDVDVPADATAVALNVTIDQPSKPTYLQVYPKPLPGDPPPSMSNLNVSAHEQRATLVLARVGADGAVRIGNFDGSAHVVADLVGFSAPTAATRVKPMTPYRAVDTRLGQGTDGNVHPLGAGEFIDVALPFVPHDATAVIVNVTATEASAPTFIAALPGHQAWNGTSTLNAGPGETTPNLAIVPLPPDKTIRLFNFAGQAHVIVDVAGFVTMGGDSSFVAAAQPVRVLDTRSGLGQRGGVGPLGSIALEVPGLPVDATAVALTLTGDRATTSTNVRAFPSGGADVPIISNLNLNAGTARANLVIVEVGPDRLVRLFNQVGHVDLVADVVGWFTP